MHLVHICAIKSTHITLAHKTDDIWIYFSWLAIYILSLIIDLILSFFFSITMCNVVKSTKKNTNYMEKHLLCLSVIVWFGTCLNTFLSLNKLILKNRTIHM